ncbi:MAG: tetratricopeptide repeat protein [Gemmatimonadetes bacterium]|nr:tetratricopeptide repeat protein [Gemmatimonadota bacterium]
MACASASDWSGAAAAFSAAAALLSREPETTASDALALVLSNLAHACARDGRAPEAMRHARRALALRESLVGQASPVVARTRMDLAVLLASSGQLAAARAMLDEALLRLEERFGPHDPRLAEPLENSSRLSLLSGDPDRAVSDWHRLHAIVDRHHLPTTRLEALAGRLVAGGADPAALHAGTADGSAAGLGLADAELADVELAAADLMDDGLADDGLVEVEVPETMAEPLPHDHAAMDPGVLPSALEEEAPYAPTPLEVVMQEPQGSAPVVPPPSEFELEAMDWGVADDLMVPWGALDGGALVFDAEVVAQPGALAASADAPNGDAEAWDELAAAEAEFSAAAPGDVDAFEDAATAGAEAEATGAGVYAEDAAGGDATAGETMPGAAAAFPLDADAPPGWGAPPAAAGAAVSSSGAAGDDIEVPWADEDPTSRAAAVPGTLLHEPSPEIPDFLFPAASEAPLPPEVSRFAPPEPARSAAMAPVQDAAGDAAPIPGGRAQSPTAPVFTTHHGEERLERLAPELVEEAEWGRTGAATPHDGSVAVHQSPMTKYEEIVRRASRQPSLAQGRRRRTPMSTGRVVLLSAITVAVVGVGGASWWLLLH